MSLHPSRQIHPYYRYLYSLLVVFALFYLVFKVGELIANSLFMTNNSRINVIYYGSESAFYSIDKRDARHYVMYFPPDLKMQVPGGYKSYRVGSLGKLAKLEHKPDILQKTFSVATTSFVTLYFYPDTEDVYYGKKVSSEKQKPSLASTWFLKSNANFFDRIYLTFSFLENKTEDFHIISYSEKVNAIQDDVFFQEDSFIKESIGLLYQRDYRDEQKSVQIQYPHKYMVAESIGSILEGNGIRVSDISLDIDGRKDCVILESSEKTSITARDLSHFFTCPIKKSQTDVYDIIFVLGETEKSWEVTS